MKVKKVLGLCVSIFAFCSFGNVYAQETETSDEVVADVSVVSGPAYSVEKKVEFTHNHVRLKLRGDQGSFGIYALSASGKEIPLLSSYDYFSSTNFSLRVGRKEYRMNFGGGVKSEARKTPYGAQMAYEIPGKASFIVDFTFPNEDDELDEKLKDCIRVSLYTQNLSDNPQTFTVKGIFDTILGESTSTHFSTAAVPEMNNQKQFHSMKNDKWVRSANKKAAMQLLLCGADISEPECVTLGPLDSLSKYWNPEIYESKGYSTVLSYNNSGVAVNWKTAYLLASQTDVKTFYISVAEGVEPIYAGKKPAGDELIDSLESGKQLFPDCPRPVSLSSTGVGGNATESVELSPAAQAVTEEQLDPEYIQNLIDYIESLNSADDIDRNELKSLNEELDAIFEKLRSLES